MAEMTHTATERPVDTYQIGDLTMAYVFKPSNITDVADMQAVFDAMERGLEMKNEHIRDLCREHAQQLREARNG